MTPRAAPRRSELSCQTLRHRDAVSHNHRLGRGARATARMLPLFLLCLGSRVSGFNGWEHETISQLSLLVASNYVSVTLGAPTNANRRLPVLRETVATFYEGLPEAAEWRKPNAPPITFGQITMLADYMKDSYDMLHLPHARVNLPVDAKTCNLPYLRSLLGNGGDFLSLASATHEDYNHFQGRALDAFCCNHKLAVTAASETNLWGALMLSAYSLHFLEDSFAAGHVLTPRDPNSHDLDVALLHDDYNKRGLFYIVEAPRELTNLAGTARAFIDASSQQWRSADGKPAHVLSLTNGALDVYCARLATQPRLAVHFLGDGQMTVTNQQPALMLMYCSRAIVDVLESYLGGAPTNSFPSYVWDRRTFGPMHSQEAIEMRLPFGGLTCSSSLGTGAQDQSGGESATAAAAAPGERATNYTAVASLTGPIYRNPGFAFSLGFESVSDSQGSHVRGLLEAEALVTGGRLDISRDTEQLREREFPQNLWPRAWGLTLGYSQVAGADDTGQGGFVRVIWPLAAVNLQISAQFGARYYWGQGEQGVKDFEMLRFDWGMHVLTLFVGVGHDSYSRAEKSFFSGLAFEAGVCIALPYSKLKNPAGMFE